MGSQQSTSFKGENEIPLGDTNKREKIIGDHETHLSDGSEGELHTHNVVCEKNPGHTEFIPLDKFTSKHLPRGQRDNALYNYIKAVAYLTVKFNVYTTSPHRPEVWPETNKPYPFYDMRGQEGLRTGSGMIHKVHKYTDKDAVWRNLTKCWCTKCEHSDSPSNVWWEFNVYTAAHVAFDGFEASHTTLRLFYDNKDSPVVIVDKVSFNYVSIEDDSCSFRCVTCDKNIGDNLEKMREYYLDVYREVNYKYQYKNSKPLDKLIFIVSHPHGCTKQISFGYWIKKDKVGTDKIKLTYTTCTCPGSSGAPVHCVRDRYGWWWWWIYRGPVHSGTISEHKYNYSGVGWW